MPEIVLLSDHYRRFNPDVAFDDVRPRSVAPSTHGVPSPEDLREAKTIVVLGPLESEPHARQLAASLAVAGREQSLAIGFLYSAGLSAADKVFLQGLDIEGASAERPHSRRVKHLAQSASFATFFDLYGDTRITFTSPDDAELLGTDDGGEVAAFAVPRGESTLYVLPYTVADVKVSHTPLVEYLIQAIQDHRGGADAPTPEYFSELALPGEPELRSEIADLDARREELGAELQRLERFHHLVGRLSGHAFEQLVIEALNLVLASTDYEAQDREDVGAEDFWIVRRDKGDDFALAEAKGIGTHVRRRDVSQVEMHRAELQADDADELPGLLVVNIFRGSDDLERRRTPLAGSIVGNAARFNVLVLRGWDLYQLVGRALTNDEQVGDHFVAQLEAGGGWLEVRPDALTLHAGKSPS